MHHAARSPSRFRRLAVGAAAAATATALIGLSGSPAQADKLGTATVTPATHLKDGDAVTVSFSGFPAGALVVAVQCDQRVLANGDDTYCDAENFAYVFASDSGAGTMAFTVHARANFKSTNGQGVCDAQHPCYMAVTTEGQPEPTNAIAALAFGSPTTTEAGLAKRKVKQGKKLKLAVSVTSPVAGTPSGSIVVKEGTKTIKTKPFPGAGVVPFKVRLTPGRHQLTISYSGDAAYLESSDSVVVKVKPKR